LGGGISTILIDFIDMSMRLGRRRRNLENNSYFGAHFEEVLPRRAEKGRLRPTLVLADKNYVMSNICLDKFMRTLNRAQRAVRLGKIKMREFWAGAISGALPGSGAGAL